MLAVRRRQAGLSGAMPQQPTPLRLTRSNGKTDLETAASTFRMAKEARSAASGSESGSETGGLRVRIGGERRQGEEEQEEQIDLERKPSDKDKKKHNRTTSVRGILSRSSTHDGGEAQIGEDRPVPFVPEGVWPDGLETDDELMSASESGHGALGGSSNVGSGRRHRSINARNSQLLLPMQLQDRVIICHQCHTPISARNITYDITDGQEFVLQEAHDAADAESFWFTDDASSDVGHGIARRSGSKRANKPHHQQNDEREHVLPSGSSLDTFGRHHGGGIASSIEGHATSGLVARPPTSDTSPPTSGNEGLGGRQERMLVRKETKGKKRAPTSWDVQQQRRAPETLFDEQPSHQQRQRRSRAGSVSSGAKGGRSKKRLTKNSSVKTTRTVSTTPSIAAEYANQVRQTTLSGVWDATDLDAYGSDAHDILDVYSYADGDEDDEESSSGEEREDDGRRISITPASPLLTSERSSAGDDDGRFAMAGLGLSGASPNPSTKGLFGGSVRTSSASSETGSGDAVAERRRSLGLPHGEPQPDHLRNSFLSYEKDFDPRFGSFASHLLNTPTTFSKPLAEMNEQLANRGSNEPARYNFMVNPHAPDVQELLESPAARGHGQSMSFDQGMTGFERIPAPLPRYLDDTPLGTGVKNKDLPPLPPPMPASRASVVRSSRHSRIAGFRPKSAIRTSGYGAWDLQMPASAAAAVTSTPTSLSIVPPSAAARQGGPVSAPVGTDSQMHRVPVSASSNSYHQLSPVPPRARSTSTSSTSDRENLMAMMLSRKRSDSESSTGGGGISGLKGDTYPPSASARLLARRAPHSEQNHGTRMSSASEQSHGALCIQSEQGHGGAASSFTHHSPQQQQQMQYQQQQYDQQQYQQSQIPIATAASLMNLYKPLPVPHEMRNKRRSRALPPWPSNDRSSIWRAPQWQPPVQKQRLASIRYKAARSLSRKITRRRRRTLPPLPREACNPVTDKLHPPLPFPRGMEEDEEEEIADADADGIGGCSGFIAGARGNDKGPTQQRRARKGSFSSISDGIESILAPLRKAVADSVQAAARSGAPLRKKSTARLSRKSTTHSRSRADVGKVSVSQPDSDAEEDWPAPAARSVEQRKMHPRYNDDLPPLPPPSPKRKNTEQRKSLADFAYLGDSISESDVEIAPPIEKKPPPVPKTDRKKELVERQRLRGIAADSTRSPTPGATIRTKRWREAYEPGRIARKRGVELRVQTDVESISSQNNSSTNHHVVSH